MGGSQMSPMVTPMTRPFAVDVKLRGSGSGWTESERMAAKGSASRGLLVPHARVHAAGDDRRDAHDVVGTTALGWSARFAMSARLRARVVESRCSGCH